MPKQLFYNLSEEKRNRLILASNREFIRVPFEEVSINKIIKDANISRGSFYLYFNGKEDLLEYIIMEYKETLMNTLYKSLERDDIDIFNVFTELFEYITQYITKAENISLYKNIFSNLKIKDNLSITKSHEEIEKKYIKKIIEKVNKNKLNIREKDDITDMVSILISILKESIVEITCFRKNRKDVKKSFLNKIRLIKKGFLKD